MTRGKAAGIITLWRVFLILQDTDIFLALCKKVVERHWGTIRIESQPGLAPPSFHPAGGYAKDVVRLTSVGSLPMLCIFCKNPVTDDRIGFRDECPRCGGDLHICRHCRFYDPYASRQCREPAIPEGVKDKERRNLCEYFKPAAPGPEETGESAGEDARRKLEALFKK